MPTRALVEAARRSRSGADAVVGISASGGAPYVVARCESRARLGALTIALTSVAELRAWRRAAELAIVVDTGAEPIAGSTRLKAGTAQKLVLNAISTATMIRLGRVYDNLMVDVVATNAKLHARALRLVVNGLGRRRRREPARCCRRPEGSVKVAVVMERRGVEAPPQARELLEERQRRILAAPPLSYEQASRDGAHLGTLPLSSLVLAGLLVANRGEIAIRCCGRRPNSGSRRSRSIRTKTASRCTASRPTRAISSGSGRSPVQAYLDIDDIVRIALEARVDAIHPGYGFLSENPDFADAVRAAGMIFVGRRRRRCAASETKSPRARLPRRHPCRSFRRAARCPLDTDEAVGIASEKVGFPVMLKASWGGGGRGMRVLSERR
jgi:hypothetical protein